ncbi:TetR/AcrR family transcriptional regulator [Pseudomonas sp. PDM14]|uniref:TetR/AcrR family transcriptional regulator n=1 Tax=Pseudomonas sp. PDM14 TaxID=2769288 RepID=UPI0017839CEE|nr:TetR/AcrR family transcriptional regulator [Pseudomonas sp. PDM14]MBD9483562.1 TetR/AcrR family transcriptional regulator [Pseudomonas sp. PDM14]
MAPKNKTRDRIIDASLSLFNAQGERSVTTNHLAAHLGMSPGNLYYHFRNKQAIIAELFAQYADRVNAFLRPPQGRALTVDDKTFYLEALLASMWHYRFLHRDLEHLLETDEELAIAYREFASNCLQRAKSIYQGFADAGILAMNATQIEALTLNSWIILTSWVRFLCTIHGTTSELSEEMMRRGIYQVLALESGHVTAQAEQAVEALNRKLHVPLERILLDAPG